MWLGTDEKFNDAPQILYNFYFDLLISASRDHVFTAFNVDEEAWYNGGNIESS